MSNQIQGKIKVHAWNIDPQEYERHRERRGRVHAFEKIDPTRTALIVVDMIPFFVNENPYCRGIVPNINALANSLRSGGGTVAWVLPASATDVSDLNKEFFGPRIADLYNFSAGSGALHERIWHELAVGADDFLLEKSATSAFFPGYSLLPEKLESRHIDTVLVTGTVTNVCCESSARDARTLGYRVIMVADANAGSTDESHNATLRTIYRSFGDVRATSEVLQLIRDGSFARPLGFEQEEKS